MARSALRAASRVHLEGTALRGPGLGAAGGGPVAVVPALTGSGGVDAAGAANLVAGQVVRTQPLARGGADLRGRCRRVTSIASGLNPSPAQRIWSRRGRT